MTLTLLSALTAAALGKGAYYGVNYTVPFAHAYRALGTLGVDPHSAIDRDVHHFALLGLDAFRLHLWDVELTDSVGDLIENEHLELLDYLLWKLEQNGISVILTAQTNFGNGYPERNSDSYGAFSYRYGKCDVHDNPAAVAAQQRYIAALVNHLNPYTSLTYSADDSIIAIEVNNEPCHSGTAEEVAAYVDAMASALRQAGWTKDILYNVSHNLDRNAAFYRPDIQGTTYQWYPSGLVHGSVRKGNFLPVLTEYAIPFDTIAGFDQKSRVVYEFDPADVLDTYLYPAAARAFRKAGFEWATQFAYDPIDMARFNTEYQTHFLNVAYTPGKAVGMAIAAEAMRRIPLGRDYGRYPADTVFGEEREFLVSARRNLALLNDGTHYYNTNTTDERPRNMRKLSKIKGVGSSPVVTTDGTGAYFLDRLSDDVWRLELMPDVFLTADPFARPSLSRSVADIIDAPVTMSLSLPGLPENFRYEGRTAGTAEGGTATFLPGVYVLSKNLLSETERTAARLGDYVMPKVNPVDTKVLHTPQVRNLGSKLEVNAVVLSDLAIDSVKVYPASVDFWRERNELTSLSRSGKYGWQGEVPVHTPAAPDFGYWIVVFTPEGATTFPGAVQGTPLDWDFTSVGTYTVPVVTPERPIIIVDPTRGLDGAELAMVPESWRGLELRHEHRAPLRPDVLRLEMKQSQELQAVVATKYIAGLEPTGNTLSIKLGEVAGTDNVTVTLTDLDGFSFAATVSAQSGRTIELGAADFSPAPTMLNPCPYPAFMSRYFVPEHWPDFAFDRAMTLSWGVENPQQPFTIEIENILITK